ncbi:MAG: membrane protein insertion efficiency factor YidD [Chloroherpetonaceae bacterium]|nr:membrane protein insertion efficiency factor YidD [Chloroherpetonaceae bacterium]
MNSIPVVLIRFYKAAISPYLPPSCRFQPSCSQYALEAFQSHHFFKAFGLTVWRVLRCNPFVRGGYDPVPSGSNGKKHTCNHHHESLSGEIINRNSNNG